MAKTTSAVELRTMSREALNGKVVELKKELFNLRFQHATGQLEAHGRLREVRKDLAPIPRTSRRMRRQTHERADHERVQRSAVR